MKNRILKILSIIIGLGIVLIIYINSESYIQNQHWKFVEGTNIGDWLGENNFEIKNGILYTNSGKAKVVFSLGFKLIIEDIETQQKGFYVNKS